MKEKQKYLNILKYAFNREMNYLLHEKRSFLIFIFISPIIIYLLIYGVYFNPSIREIPIAVIDYDNSEISRQAIGSVNASPYVSIERSFTNLEEAKKHIVSAKLYGVLVVPEDFSKKVLGYKGADVILYYNNELFIIGSLVNKGVLTAIQDFSNIYNKKYMMSKGIPAYSAEFQVHAINIGDKNLFNPYLNYQYFFVFGLLVASFQLFVICVVVYGFVREEKNKTFLNSVFRANVAPLSFVTGKTIPYLVLTLFQLMILLFFLFIVLGTPLVGSFSRIIVASLMYALISVTAGVFIAIIFRPLAFSASAVYAAPAFAYAGITYPQIAMPHAAQLFSEFLPITRYHRVLVNEAIRGSAPYNNSLTDIVYMFVLGLIVYFIGVAVLKAYSYKYSNLISSRMR